MTQKAIKSRKIFVTGNVRLYEHVFPDIKHHDSDIEENQQENSFNYLLELVHDKYVENKQIHDMDDINQILRI